MIWLLGGYMWLFIHRPFEVWPVLGTLHIERVYMLVTIAYWALFAEKSWTRNRLNAGFLCLAVAILASSLLSPYSPPLNETVENWFKVAVFYVLVMSTVRDQRDLKLLVLFFVIATGLYLAHSLCEFSFGRRMYRMGVTRMMGVDRTYSHPNALGETVLFALPMIIPLWSLAKRKWHRGLLIAYVGLSLVCILLTGSRTAFVGLCFLMLLLGLLSRHRVKVSIAVLIAAPLIWLSLPAHLQNRYLTLVDSKYGPENAETSAEGRLRGWRDGVGLWKARPITGVGPGAFGVARGTGINAHNLYGQVLGELGTFGAVALAMIVFGFAANTREVHRAYRHAFSAELLMSYRLSMAVGITVLLLLLMGWGGHNLYRYTWLWYGAFQALVMQVLANHRERDVIAEDPDLIPEYGDTIILAH